MNILSVNKYFWKKGGSETVFFGEKQLLESHGHQVIPFSMQSSQNLETPFSKYFVTEVNYTEKGLYNKISAASKIIYSFEARRKIESLLRDHSPDLAHFHIFQHQISPSVFGPLQKRKIPILLTLHDLKPICPNYKMLTNGRVREECKGKRFYNCTLNRCTKGSLLGSLTNTLEMYFHYLMGYYQSVDYYIAPSQFIKNKFIDFGFPESKMKYLPNFIDAPRHADGSRDDRYVLYFGRLSHEKGLPTLLRSAKSTPRIRYRIVGNGPLERELQEWTEREKLSNVIFHGYQTGNTLKKLLEGASCVVLPSEWYENCPMSLLEAFASAKPVIGTDIGGIPELIENGEDGIVVPPGDHQALADAIRTLWENPEQAKAMGQAGFEKVKERHSPEKHYQGLISIYESALSK